MAYIIAQPCISVKDGACTQVCPMDCIKTSDDSPQFYINPNECTSCGACETECPVGAIFYDSDLPVEWKHFEQINAQFFETDANWQAEVRRRQNLWKLDGAS